MTTENERRIAELRAEADRLEAINCTGLTARWCPTHGDCRCTPPDDWFNGGDMDDPNCPLHAPDSSHAEPSGVSQ